MISDLDTTIVYSHRNLTVQSTLILSFVCCLKTHISIFLHPFCLTIIHCMVVNLCDCFILYFTCMELRLVSFLLNEYIMLYVLLDFPYHCREGFLRRGVIMECYSWGQNSPVARLNLQRKWWRVPGGRSSVREVIYTKSIRVGLFFRTITCIVGNFVLFYLCLSCCRVENNEINSRRKGVTVTSVYRQTSILIVVRIKWALSNSNSNSNQLVTRNLIVILINWIFSNINSKSN